MKKDAIVSALLNGNLDSLQQVTGSAWANETLTDPQGYGVKALELALRAEVSGAGSSQLTAYVLDETDLEISKEILLGLASEDKYLPKMGALLKAGMPVDSLFKNQTALQRATGNGNQKMVHLLLSHGADPHHPGEYGTAYEEAKSQHYQPAFQGMMDAFLTGESKSPFDFIAVDKIRSTLQKWALQIAAFAPQVAEETIYVVGFESGRLKLNSEDAFEKNLARYREMFPGKYQAEADIESLRYNIGDFSYHDLGSLPEEVSGAPSLDWAFLERQEADVRTEKEVLYQGLLSNLEALLAPLQTTAQPRVIASGHVY